MKYTRHPNELNSIYTKRLAIWLLTFAMAITIPTLSSSKTAHASLFSFLTSIFEGSKVSAQLSEASSSNSQTLALFVPAVNIDPNPDKATEVSPIVNGETFIADIVLSENATEENPVNTQISIYKVQSGDTVSGIAKMFDVSVSTVLWANNLNSKSALKVGSTLVILPISGVTHTIAKGDTIQGIVKKYKADLDEVLAYNDISINSPISIGQKIIIPNAEIVISVPTRKIGANPAHDTGGPSYPGYYARPVDGGRRSQGLHGYNGVDIADKVGTPIYAAAAGTVIVARSTGWNGGYGGFVIISHDNGTQTLYAHASKVLVSAGQYVNQGDKIALMGSTGRSTGSHLHFEIRGAKNPF